MNIIKRISRRIIALLIVVCLMPSILCSGILDENPLAYLSDLYIVEFSREGAVSSLEDLQRNPQKLPPAWRSYMAACFALELQDYQLFRKYVNILKNQDRDLYIVVVVMHHLLVSIRKGRSRDHSQPLPLKLRLACEMNPRVRSLWPFYSKQREQLLKQEMSSLALKALRWRHSNEVIWAFAEVCSRLDFQDRLQFLLAQAFFERYGISTRFGKVVARYIAGALEIQGPRDRYIHFMRKLGWRPKTIQEIEDEIIEW